MSKQQARLIALEDITRILAVAAPWSNGVVPAFMANRHISQKDKMRIAEEYDTIRYQLDNRRSKLQIKLNG